MTDEYRIPTYRLPVELRLTGRGTVRAGLFLGEHAERGHGRERPLDLLNGDKSFLPVRLADGGHVLLRREAVLVASLSAADALKGDPSARELLEESGHEETDARSVEVDLTFEEGSEVSGRVAYVQPRGQQRLQDFLNDSDTFFRVWEDETVHLVNSARAVSISARGD